MALAGGAAWLPPGTAAGQEARRGPDGAAAAQAAAEPEPACPSRGARVRVELSDPEPTLRLDATAAELLAESGRSSPGAQVHHLGLTVSRVEWRSEITARYLTSGGPSGAVCAVPAEVRVALLHAEHVIRVAREVPANGCLRREVEAHERRHVAVNRRTLRDASTELRGLVEAWAAQAEARAADVEAATDALQDGLRRAMEPALERMRRARERGHAAIDTPEEYRRLGRVCPSDQERLRVALRRSGQAPPASAPTRPATD